MTDLVLFDLDHTLLDGDSDFSWGDFLCEIGAVDADVYRTQNQKFFDQYQSGELDIMEYLKFALEPLAQNNINTLLQWRQQFLNEKIKPMIIDEAAELVNTHINKGDITAIITSTNAFITEPIGHLFGIKTVIATQPQLINGRFSGNVEGTPCFRDGKVQCLQKWLNTTKPNYQQSWFYSDSFNDMPLLSWVDNPVVVNGDTQLCEHALNKGWQTLSIG